VCGLVGVYFNGLSKVPRTENNLTRFYINQHFGYKIIKSGYVGVFADAEICININKQT